MLPTRKKIGFVCNDAGAANIICSWIQTKDINKYNFYLKGPAIQIFKHLNIKNQRNMKKVILSSDVIVAGTGWMSDVEFNAIKIANLNKIYSIAVIDHWVNYKERFIRNRKLYYPNEFWVTDRYAYNIAKKYFPSNNIFLKKNNYLNIQLDKIKKSKSDKKTILYILEPIRKQWIKNKKSEFQSLNFFLSKLEKISLPKEFIIKLRLHPSEKKTKYNNWIKKQKINNIELDKNIDLHQSIGESYCVVGLNSFALVIALKSYTKVYCSLPPWAPLCVLPFKKIVHLRNL